MKITTKQLKRIITETLSDSIANIRAVDRSMRSDWDQTALTDTLETVQMHVSTLTSAVKECTRLADHYDLSTDERAFDMYDRFFDDIEFTINALRGELTNLKLTPDV